MSEKNKLKPCFYCGDQARHPLALCNPCNHLYKDKILLIELNSERTPSGRFHSLTSQQLKEGFNLSFSEEIKFITISDNHFDSFLACSDIKVFH